MDLLSVGIRLTNKVRQTQLKKTSSFYIFPAVAELITRAASAVNGSFSF